mgnify:FL=1
MKRFSLLCVLAILCSLPAYSQFWISFGWNEPHCQNCLWMEQAMHLPARQAAEYHKIIHKYGQKIEKRPAVTIGIGTVRLAVFTICVWKGIVRSNVY